MFPSTRQSVSDIRTTFEPQKDSSSSVAGQQSRPRPSAKAAGLFADMSPSKRLAPAQKSTQPSTSTVGDKAASTVPAALYPSKKPSWIGPRPSERAPLPSPSTMQQYPVTVEYTSPGLQPPVYICTSLSNPPWEPIEMESTQSADGECTFSMTFAAEEGQYQYKLRLGPGDWWVCDGSKPKVDDGAGNENNLIVVKPAAPTVPTIKEPEREPSRKIDSHTAPLMPHESNPHPDHARHVSTPTEPAKNEPEPEHASPLFRHESFVAPEEAINDDGSGPENVPVLQHESVSPTSHEQEHSPLFRHESIAMDHKHASHHGHHKHHASPRLSDRKCGDLFMHEEADLSDPSLQQFPTDHKGIIEHLERTRRSLDEDTTSLRHCSPSRSPGESAVVSASPSLPSLAEGVDESDEATAKAAGEIPQVRIFEPSEIPTAPITPPLTPEEKEANELVQVPVILAAVREKTEELKGKGKEKATQAKGSGIPTIAMGIAFAIAAASAALAVWYIRAQGDHIFI